MGLTIRQVSEITGFPPSTLRYYEKEKMLPPIKRNANGVRVFTDEYMEWISIIKCLKETNMPVHHIKEFVALCVKGDSTLKERLNIVMKHQEDIKSQIAALQTYQKHIAYKAEYYKKACDAGTEDAVRGLYRPVKRP